MQVFQTAGVPPRIGRIIFAIIGWTKNNDSELTKRVIANSAAMPNLKVRRQKSESRNS
jgi:hypothetical protein